MNKRRIGISVIAVGLAVLMLLSLLCGVLPTRASAASSSEILEQINDLKSQQAENQAQMDALEQQKNENASEIQQVIDEKKRIDQQIFLLLEQVANINEQISAYSVLIADKQDELDAAEVRYNELRDKYRERIRAMEEEGALSYWSVLFKANSFADLLDRLNMIEEIAASDQRRLQELNSAAQLVADAQAELEAEKASLEDTKRELNASQEQLSQKREEADALLADLQARGDEFLKLIEDAEAEQSRLMLEIIEQESAYDDAVNREYWATYVPPTTTAPPTQSTDSTQDADNSGDSDSTDDGDNDEGDSGSDATWLTPVPYYTLTSPFGWRTHPIYGNTRFHEGVDLACAEGTSIYATRSGTVRSAGYNDSMGFYVSIDHGDGYRSIYMHMTNFIVSAGEYVSAGQTIGYVGSTGDSTGPHLHFGIYDVNAGCYVNPMNYI